MKAEKIVMSFIAILIGLIAAGATFYFYQMTKVIPKEDAQPLNVKDTKIPSPTPDKGNILSVDTPKDEEVFDKKIISIKGKTAQDATIIVTAEDADQIVKPSANGDFSLTQTVPEGTTVVYITAIFPNGEEKQLTRTVTYTSETF